MATVTVRNLSQETVDALKERAKLNDRSMEAEARSVLAQLAQERSVARGKEVSGSERWLVMGGEVMERIARNPAPSLEDANWLTGSRADFDAEEFRDPWERRDPA